MEAGKEQEMEKGRNNRDGYCEHRPHKRHGQMKRGESPKKVRYKGGK